MINTTSLLHETAIRKQKIMRGERRDAFEGSCTKSTTSRYHLKPAMAPKHLVTYIMACQHVVVEMSEYWHRFQYPGH
jgi:hypothetical protein